MESVPAAPPARCLQGVPGGGTPPRTAGTKLWGGEALDIIHHDLNQPPHGFRAVVAVALEHDPDSFRGSPGPEKEWLHLNRGAHRYEVRDSIGSFDRHS